MSARLSRVLSSLPHFVAVAEELHFGRAAERLGLSQPPLSRRIQLLEKELAAQLFRRNRHKVELTQAGEVLLKRARTLLSQADEMAEEVHRIAQGPSSRLRIGFVNSTLHSVLPPVMQEFSHKYPDVELVLSELPTEVQI